MVCLGLLTCSVPPRLKAALLNTLAAFAKTPDIAVNLWQAVESTQVREAYVHVMYGYIDISIE